MDLISTNNLAKFRFGQTLLSGNGLGSDCEYHHVRHLRLHNSSWRTALSCCISRFPLRLRSFLWNRWPKLFLPPSVLIKLRKPGWETDFENEISIYEHLKPIQGRAVPILYGAVDYGGTPALLLEDVQGITPFQQERPYLPIDTLQSGLYTAYEALRSVGVMIGEIKLDNNLLVEEKIVFVDLEDAEIVDSIESWTIWMDSSIEQLCQHYQILLEDV